MCRMRNFIYRKLYILSLCVVNTLKPLLFTNHTIFIKWQGSHLLIQKVLVPYLAFLIFKAFRAFELRAQGFIS